MIQNLILFIIILGGLAGYLERSLSSNGAIAAVLVGASCLLRVWSKGTFPPWSISLPHQAIGQNIKA